MRILTNTFHIICFFLLASSSVISQKNIKVTFVNENVGANSESEWFQDLLKKEIGALLKNRFEVAFNTHYCGYDLQKMASNFDLAFNDEDTDIVIGLGSMSSSVLANRNTFPKPSIAGIIIHHELQKVPYQDGVSGVDNFTYIQSPFDLDRDLKALHRLYPFKKVGVIGGSNLVEYLPFLGQILEQTVSQWGSTYQIIPFQNSVASTLSAIPDDVDAIYLLPIFDEMNTEGSRQFFTEINNRGLPSMALLGEQYLETGALLCYEGAANLQRMPRRIAINVLKIAEGQNAGDLPVDIPTYNETLLINMAAARQSGQYPDWDMMSDALLLNVNDLDTERKLSLQSVIVEALQQNLDLKIAEANPKIAQKDVDLARANLLPQAEANTSFALLDKTTTQSSFGAQGRVNWLASGNISQLILSEPALANMTIQKLLQKGQEYHLEQTQLDVVLDASTAFLNLLQAQKAVQVQNQNVLVTKENYDIAKAKEAVGYAGASDLNRWASELALENIDLNEAQARYNQAGFLLNQLLNRPIDEEFTTEDASLTDQMLFVADQRMDIINNYGDLEKLADFLVLEAFNYLPELKQVDYSIAAQRRLKRSQERAFYLPSVALSGEINYIIDKWKVPEIAPELQMFGLGNTENKPTWNVGVGFQYPILQGGTRRFNKEQTELNILQLQDQRSNLQNQLELLVRSNLETVGASFSRVELSQKAADAAKKNFNIIQDAYSQGQVNITTLIDAQNASLQTELGAVNAIFTFILDFLELERSVGFYYFLATPEERNAWFNRLTSYMATH